MFDFDKSRVCPTIQKLEPVLATVMAISKRKHLFKTEPQVPKNTRAFVNSGYQGLDKLHPEIELPFKASKRKPLDREEKEYNTALSRIRVKVENIIGDLKTFRILLDLYRNKRKRYNVKFNIIAAIVNLKNVLSRSR